jgi:hypothetical protein
LIKSLRKINWKHILSLFWRLYSYKFKFFSFFFKIFIKFKFNKIFNNVFLINYGFLSFYYLENNKYIYNYLKKNILLYRIFSKIISNWCNYRIFDYFNKIIDMHSHKYYSLKNPILRKKWYFNYIRKFNKKQLFSPLIKNKSNSFIRNRVNLQSISNILINNSNLVDNNLVIILNSLFKIFWFIFFKLVVVKFFDIISLIDINNNLNIYFFNLKYSLEFILWEIFHSNDNRFINYKYYLSFYFIFKKIKIDNLLSIFYTRYFNTVLYSLLYYNNKNNNEYFIHCIFLFSFLCDLFLNIIILKNKFINWSLFFFNNLNLFYKFKLNYNLFFFYNFNYYLINQRWNNFYLMNKNTFFSEYKFNFTEEYKNQLKEVIKIFYFI